MGDALDWAATSTYPTLRAEVSGFPIENARHRPLIELGKQFWICRRASSRSSLDVWLDTRFRAQNPRLFRSPKILVLALLVCFSGGIRCPSYVAPGSTD